MSKTIYSIHDHLTDEVLFHSDKIGELAGWARSKIGKLRGTFYIHNGTGVIAAVKIRKTDAVEADRARFTDRKQIAKVWRDDKNLPYDKN